MQHANAEYKLEANVVSSLMMTAIQNITCFIFSPTEEYGNR